MDYSSMSAKPDTEQFRYLMTTMSVIISLAITTVLRGLGQLIPARIHVKLYFPHFCYPILILMVLVEYWGMWEWRSQEWQFWPFLFALISPSVLYLVSVLILPDVSSHDVDLKAHYFDYRPWFFSLAALAALLNILESLIFPPHKLLLNYNLVRVAAIVLFIVAAYSANERLHEFLPFVLLVLLVIFVVMKTRHMDGRTPSVRTSQIGGMQTGIQYAFRGFRPDWCNNIL